MKYPSLRRSTASLVAGGALLTGALLVQGCLQREVKEQQPNTSNVFVEQIINSEVNEIDLLFVVDNSVSMGDKQEILRKAVPAMVERLITPNCVNEAGEVVGQSSLVEITGGESQAQCATGTPEFTPVNDIHLGVITSSLGGHGSIACQRNEPPFDDGTVPTRDDQGQLIATVRSVSNAGEGGLGFLAWTGGDEATQNALIADFEEHVSATGEVGCGYEATLESWYRFLVDPQPPQEIVLQQTENGGSRSAAATDPATGATLLNQDVLAQRAAFLRPESLVAIIVLSDENDCSVMDGGAYYGNSSAGWLLTTPARLRRQTEPVTAGFLMPVSTEICKTNPNDECCLSCLQNGQAPDRCDAQLAVCDGNQNPKVADVDFEGDENNVRCFDNKRRFGVDLLYPTQRYVDALTKQQIIDARSGELVPNPLIVSAGGVIRDPGLVFFAGIVGLPWQDVATPETLDSPNRLSLLTASQLSEPVLLPGDEGPRSYNRWDVILGRPGLPEGGPVCRERDDPACGQQPVRPLDPFMIESIVPRDTSLSNPITGQPIVAATSNDPTATINGHEVDHTQPDQRLGDGFDDLQFACIFPLAEAVDEETCEERSSCDCFGEPSRNSPLCQPPGGGPAEKAQYFGKAYPGTRILQVLKDFGNNSIVSSICPKVIDESEPDFGYNPAVQAIVDRLSEVLTGACLPRELTVDEEGRVPCFVVEARRPGATETPLTCERPGREVVSADIRTSVEKQLRDTDRCDGNSGVACRDYEMCTLVELTGGVDGREECLYNEADTEDPTVFTNPGFCYIDPAKQDGEGNYTAGGNPPSGEAGTNPIVDSCPATERRLLRFVGQDTPAESAITFVACTGDAAGSDDPIPTLPERATPAPTDGAGLGGTSGG